MVCAICSTFLYFTEVLTGMLSRYGKLVSPIQMIPIGCKSPLLKQVVSFRCYVYMILQNNLALHFHQDKCNYVIFVITNSMKCFACGEMCHLIRACPDRLNQPDENHLLADGEKIMLGAIMRSECYCCFAYCC